MVVYYGDQCSNRIHWTATLNQPWARYLEGDNISTKIGLGRDRDRGGLPNFWQIGIGIGEASPIFWQIGTCRDALSRVFLDFSRPFLVRKKLGKIEGNREKSRETGINRWKSGKIGDNPNCSRLTSNFLKGRDGHLDLSRHFRKNRDGHPDWSRPYSAPNGQILKII